MKKNVAENRMIKMFPTARPDETVAGVEQLLLGRAKEFETINYIYITDTENRLLGVISIKEIFGNPKNALVRNLMETKIITARQGTHQEKIANLALKHSLKSIPIVDKENRLLGIIPSDVILKILHEEHGEDILRSAGVLISKDQTKDIISGSMTSYFIKRIPWLIVGLAGGVSAAFIVGSFEEAIREMLILAAFIPAIVYMADAVGAQTATIFIRSLAIDGSMGIKKYVIREILVGTAIALFLGILISIISFLWWGSAMLGAILGASFFATIITAIGVALFMPWIFLQMKIDPAIASGPFATVITDIISIVIYFSIASLMLKFF
ncbi:MAG: magnesium transporter [Patescibacteria group bacterium]